MKKVVSILASALLVFLIYPTTAFSQSLDRIVKQERARRAKVATSPKVYTNQDLEQFKGPATAQTTDADKSGTSDSAKSATAAESAEKPSKDGAKDAKDGVKPEPDKKPEAPTRDASYWRQQSADARAKVEGLETKGDALQLRLNDLNNKFQREQDVTQREAYQADIQKTLFEVDETKAKLEAARRDMEDLERQARRENVPPGWLR